MKNEPIPHIDFPSIDNYCINAIDDELVSLSSLGLMCESQYYMQGIKGALKDCYARQLVANRLLDVNRNLPEGLSLKVYDAYRPIEVQQYLWDYYRNKLSKDNKDLSDAELDKKTSFFVSKPSYDIINPSLHNTGGAVDVTLVDSNGVELNMGTKFDAFSNKAWTNHFEEYVDDKDVKTNRRILYNSMIKAGFTNLPSEWWHYDFGTKFWAYFKNRNALYIGILNAKLE